MRLNENKMYENVSIWLIFCILPSFGLAAILIFSCSFYSNDNKNFIGCTTYSNYSLSILLKEPPVIVAPLVTPFMYAPKASDCTKIEDVENKPSIAISSKMVFFEMDYRLCYVNNLITVCISSLGLILKAHLKLEVVLPSSALFLMLTTFLLHMTKKFDNGSSQRCFEHAEKKSDCADCTKKYGLYIKDYKQYEVCALHKNSIPCRSCGKFNEMEFKILIVIIIYRGVHRYAWLQSLFIYILCFI